MSLSALMQEPLPVTAPLVLNPLMAKMVEAAGFPAGYLGGGATGRGRGNVAAEHVVELVGEVEDQLLGLLAADAGHGLQGGDVALADGADEALGGQGGEHA